MLAKTFEFFCVARKVTPYLWGFAAATALDHVIDVQGLFLPALAAVAVMSGILVVLRRTGR